ncbi:MAG TPA: DUF3300 domain-containing protein [Casimicrobiaceae bacterium]|nr:DUF3300 domain-containing protein [Casimicrobiaceae bacterium]
MKLRSTYSAGARFVASATVVVFGWSGIVGAQAPAPAQPPSAPASAAGQPAEAGTFSQEELDQLVAPIALYPDDLLAQVLMASTYPLDVVSAERWVKANPNLKDKALEDALQQQSWDPSVKSLTPFPQVLTMMSEKLEWTQKLGDAFLAQQKDVLATAQSLRAKAAASGNLKDSQQQKVVTEKEGTTTIIKIEPSDPQVVYVPTYNPTVVYGAWPYPAYPPYYYYPPGYIAAPGLAFATGVVVGAALWGNCNWGRGDVNVNVNRYNNFNKTNISNGNWQHNADRRGAVPYKNQAVAQKYNRGASPGAQSRDAYRGRAEAGQKAARAGGGAADRGAGPTAASRESRGAGGQAASRDMSGTRSASAFDTGNRAQTQAASSRGSSSMNSARASSSASRPSGGGGRSAGGGGRAGGGGGRGGGGRR